MSIVLALFITLTGFSANSASAQVTVALPQGCYSTVGYSPTTGVKCDSLININSSLPAGCTSTRGYSPLTGIKCDSGGSRYPDGCTSSQGYSVTTGIKCDSFINGTPGDALPLLRPGCTSTSGYSSTTGTRCDGITQVVRDDKMIITEPIQGWGGWSVGTAYAIRWTNVQDPHFPKLFVSMTKSNGTRTINITNQSDGYFPYLGDGMWADPQVKIPENISPGNYRIFLTDRAGGTRLLSNAVDVTIYASTTDAQPSIISLGTNNALPGEKVAAYISNFPISTSYIYNIALTGITNNISVVGTLSTDGSYIGFTVPNISPGIYQLAAFTNSGVNSYNTLPFTIGRATPSSSYPGFFMRPDNSSYLPDDTINLTLSRADNGSATYPVDIYVLGANDNRVKIRNSFSVGQNTIFSLKMDRQSVYTGPGEYQIILCDAGQVCNGGVNTNGVVINISSQTATPSITVLSPNGGVFDNGRTQNISVSWQGYEGDFDYYTVNVVNTFANVGRRISGSISRESNGFVTTSGAIQDAIIELSGGSSAPEQGYYFDVFAIKNDGAGERGVATGRSGTFSITHPLTPPSLTITSPTTNQTFHPGDNIHIRWDSEGITGVSVDAQTVDGNIALISTSLIGNPGSYDFTLSPNTAPGAYQVRVRSNAPMATVPFTVSNN